MSATRRTLSLVACLQVIFRFPWSHDMGVELISQKTTQVSSSSQPFSKLMSLYVAPVNDWYFQWAHRSQQIHPLDGLTWQSICLLSSLSHHDDTVACALPELFSVLGVLCSLLRASLLHVPILVTGRASAFSTPFPCLYVRYLGRINLKEEGVLQLTVLRLMVGKAWWQVLKTATLCSQSGSREQWCSLFCFIPLLSPGPKPPVRMGITFTQSGTNIHRMAVPTVRVGLPISVSPA